MFATHQEFERFRSTTGGRTPAEQAAGRGAPGDDEKLSAEWVKEALASPPKNPERARPSAILAGAVGAVILLVGAVTTLSNSSAAFFASSPGRVVMRVGIAIFGLVLIGIGLAFLRIAARLWRGKPQSS